MDAIAGVRIPDSTLARDAEAMVADLGPGTHLLGHGRRTFVFGSLLARKAGIEVREELTYLASVLHDLGLTERFAETRRFEVSGADAARDWAQGQVCRSTRRK